MLSTEYQSQYHTKCRKLPARKEEARMVVATAGAMAEAMAEAMARVEARAVAEREVGSCTARRLC